MQTTDVKNELETTDVKKELDRQLHNKLELSKGIYIGDMDKMLETVEKQMPIVNSEQIYLWELEKHSRIYLAFVVLGLMLIALGFLI